MEAPNMHTSLYWVTNCLKTFCERTQIDYPSFIEDNVLLTYVVGLTGRQNLLQIAAMAKQRVMNTFMLACMVELRDLLTSMYIRYAFLKGLTLSSMLYAPYEARMSNDIDILIHQADIERVISALLENGFAFEHSDGNQSDVAIACGRQHIAPLYKEIQVDGRRKCITEEVHILPYDCEYMLYGHSMNLIDYTDYLLHRRETIQIGNEFFYTLGKTDLLYVLTLHMTKHLCLDSILYLYVNKPFQQTYIVNLLIDIALYVKKYEDEICWKDIIDTAINQHNYSQLDLTNHILQSVFNIAMPLPSVTISEKEPINTVCQLYRELPVSSYLSRRNFKSFLDTEITGRIRISGDHLPENIVIQKSDNAIRFCIKNIDADIQYSFTVLNAKPESGVLSRELIVNIIGSSYSVALDNGYRKIWEPATYGTVSEQDLSCCYTVIRQGTYEQNCFEFTVNAPELLMSSQNAFIYIARGSCYNPFINKAFYRLIH